MLAGVSADYYVRLEQGRDQHPSAQVLDALARALQLDDDAIAHLHSLAAPAVRRRRRPSPRPERVPAAILQLIASWHETPAYVYGRYMDVLAANPLATALAPYYTPGENLVRATFLDPRLRDRYEDWHRAAATVVAALRALVGPDADDPPLNEGGSVERALSQFGRADARKASGTEIARSRVSGREAGSGRRRPDRDLPRDARQPERPGAHTARDRHCHRAARARGRPELASVVGLLVLVGDGVLERSDLSGEQASELGVPIDGLGQVQVERVDVGYEGVDLLP